MEGFLAMGKYAAFIWPAYGISALGLGVAAALTLSAYARAKRKLRALEKS